MGRTHALSAWCAGLAVAPALGLTTMPTLVFAVVVAGISLVPDLGCVVHCLGDALTLSGCPFLFPIPIAGETWAELRPPAFMRFRTGGPVETTILFPAFAVLGVLLLPGAWDLVTSIFHHHTV